MSHFNGVTFAWSHTDKAWTTRYSFTPTAYAYVDNFFMSSNGPHPEWDLLEQFGDSIPNYGLWLHDSNNNHNKFYGYQYDTSVAFVSNYNPSSVKIYKSLSVESNSNEWGGFVTTNNNPSGSDQSEAQRGELNSFTRKEGTSYVDIPPSEKNSTSHITAAFSADGGVFSDLSGLTLEDLGVSADNLVLSWSVFIDNQYGQITAGKNSFLVVHDGTNLSYIKGGELVPIANASPSYDDGYAIISSLNADDGIVTVDMLLQAEDIDSFPFSWVDEEYAVVYIQAPAKTNGDYMRGHYMNVYLSNSSTTPIECLSFNVNYEPTRLDHSLSQNA